MNRRFFATALASLPLGALAQGQTFATYVNDRHGTRVTYPADYFVAVYPPTSEDGRAFESLDLQARFRVAATALQGRSMDQLKLQDRQSVDQVTYATGGNTWYVLSGYVGGEIFYFRRLVRGTTVHWLDIYYSEAVRPIMDPAVNVMSNSFGAG